MKRDKKKVHRGKPVYTFQGVDYLARRDTSRCLGVCRKHKNGRYYMTVSDYEVLKEYEPPEVSVREEEDEPENDEQQENGMPVTQRGGGGGHIAKIGGGGGGGASSSTRHQRWPPDVVSFL